MHLKCLILMLASHFLPYQVILSESDIMRVKIISDAEKYIGKRYKSRVNNNVFDCSGFARYIFSANGDKVTRSSVSQVHDGKKVADMMNARPGDLIIFKGRNSRNIRPGHVGIVHHISNDTIYFIHSSVQKGVTIDHLHDPYYKKRFLQIRDVVGGK